MAQILNDLNFEKVDGEDRSNASTNSIGVRSVYREGNDLVVIVQEDGAVDSLITISDYQENDFGLNSARSK